MVNAMSAGAVEEVAREELLEQEEAARVGGRRDRRAEHQAGVDGHHRPAVLRLADRPRGLLGLHLGVVVGIVVEPAGGVEVGLRQRPVLHRQHVDVVAEDGTHRRGEDDAGDRERCVHAGQHVAGALQRRLEHLRPPVRDLLGHQERRGDVEDHRAACRRGVEAALGEQVGLEQLELPGELGLQREQRGDLGGRGEAPNRGVHGFAVHQQRPDEVAAHEAAATGDENTHVRTVPRVHAPAGVGHRVGSRSAASGR